MGEYECLSVLLCVGVSACDSVRVCLSACVSVCESSVCVGV